MARKRARTEDGQFIADDPSTPEVNEAWVKDAVDALNGANGPEEAAPKTNPTRTAKKRHAPKNEEVSEFAFFVSSNPENSAFDLRINDARIRGVWDENRQYVHWRVPRALKDLAMLHHHIWTGRVISCEDD